jgi:hypothetical protein
MARCHTSIALLTLLAAPAAAWAPGGQAPSGYTGIVKSCDR